MVKLKPLHDKVVVEIDTEVEKTRGGIYLPDTAKEKPITGKILAVGPGKVGKDGKRQPPAVRAGDRIVFGKYSGSDVKVDGKEFKILSEDEIYGVME